MELIETAAALQGPREADLAAAISERVADSDLRESADLRPVRSPEGAADDVDALLLCDLVSGARQLAEQVRQVELTAARMARERGVTVRQLAKTAGISERAANDRYRRPATD